MLLSDYILVSFPVQVGSPASVVTIFSIFISFCVSYCFSILFHVSSKYLKLWAITLNAWD